MKSDWAIICKYVNSKVIGDRFTLEELGRLNKSRLQYGGFIRWCAPPFIYKLVNKVPSGMTLVELRLYAKRDNLGYLEKVTARKEREKKHEEK